MKQHSSRFLTLIEHVKPLINEITPQELKARLESEKPVCLIDVREDNELASGRIPGAIHLSKGIIERDIEKQITDPETPIVVYCSGGFRCALVAENLQRMGFKQVASLNTGLQGWIHAGYTLEQ